MLRRQECVVILLLSLKHGNSTENQFKVINKQQAANGHSYRIIYLIKLKQKQIVVLR